VPKRLTPPEVQSIARALADPCRFQILQHIAAQACAACSDLRPLFPITAPTLSHHLKELESAGLVQSERRGRFVDVTFDRPKWNAYLAELQRL
jgi:ArsR family transcriptional regulator, arsenate/arsenite/antimonite-responsive transcriptional repressor